MLTLSTSLRRRRRSLATGALALVLALACLVLAGPQAALVVSGSVALTWWLTPYMARLAHRVGAVGQPGGRGVHLRATPLAGGLAILVPVVALTGTQCASGTGQMAGLLAGAVLLVSIGLLDDIRDLRPRLRLLAQFGAALLLVLSGWTLPALSLGGSVVLDLGAWGPVGLVVWVVSCVNAFNLVDGMDGLCSSMALVAAGAALAWGADPCLCAVTAGGALGFLRHNASPARVFLGDAGSQLLGLLVAVTTLSVPAEGNLVLALALVAYPAGDVLVTLMRRWVRAKPLFVGDGSHVHHKLLQHLGSPRRALLAIVLFALLHLAYATLLPGPAALVAGATTWMALVLLLVLAGRVGLPRMLRSRRAFRKLHALRVYVAELLNVATCPVEVKRALRRLGEDQHLVRLALDRVGVVHLYAPAPRGTVEVDVPLKRGKASWAFVPSELDPTLGREVRTVVCDLVRLAQSRLLQFADSTHGDAREVAPSVAASHGRSEMQRALL